jgi:hypothetical protein
MQYEELILNIKDAGQFEDAFLVQYDALMSTSLASQVYCQ